MISRRMAKLLVQKPKIVLLIFFILTALVGLQISNIYMESNFTNYLPENDPNIELWQRIDEEFNLGSSIIILVNQTGRARDDIRNPDVLKEMYYDVVDNDLINEFKNDNGKKDGVVSIRSLPSMIADYNDGVIPSTRSEIDNILAKIEAVQTLEDVLYTDEGYGVIIIQLSSDADFESILEKTERAVENRGTKYAGMTITGTAAMQKAIQEDSMSNLVIMFPIALGLVALVIILFYRTLKGIIIAFLPPVIALILTFGILGIVQPQLTIVSVAIVALLMGLGVDYSIHLINRMVEEKDEDNQLERVHKTLKSTGRAVFLSTVTTMIGFGSLMISSMPPIITFGFGCAIGIFFCFISAIIVVPCLVLLLDFKKKAKLPSWKKSAGIIVKHRHRIFIISVFFVIMSLILIPKVESDVNYFDLSPEDLPEVDAIVEYSNQFGGGANFNGILVETEAYGLEQPETIQAIYEMEEEIESRTPAKATSVVDPIYETASDLEQLTPDEISAKLDNLRELLQNTSLEIPSLQKSLFNRFAEENLVDEDHSKTVILVSIPTGLSIQEYEEIIDEINQITEDTELPNYGQASQVTGQDAINVAVNKKLFEEQTRSMIVALLFVLSSLIIIFNSSKYAFLTIMPVVFVLAWEPGFLVAIDVPLSVVTISIASIMVGIGIDYGVHITQRIRENIDKGFSKFDATKDAIEKTGLSLIEASVTTIAGLAGIYFVNIPALQEFGLVIIAMTALSCVAATLILPYFYCSRIIKDKSTFNKKKNL